MQMMDTVNFHNKKCELTSMYKAPFCGAHIQSYGLVDVMVPLHSLSNQRIGLITETTHPLSQLLILVKKIQ
jgi:hypothetical protein